MLKTKELISYQNSLAEGLLGGVEYPWQALPLISQYILDLGPSLDPAEFDRKGDDIWIHKSVEISPTATLTGPLIIDQETVVRPGAFIRGNALIGKSCVIGNSTEIKNSILVAYVEVPHYNYIGDSILGPYSHMGAGSITSNIKSDRLNVVIKAGHKNIETGLRKIGAILGDRVEVGCNTVLNPGTIIGKASRIYPLSMVRGFIPAGHIYKTKEEIVLIKED